MSILGFLLLGGGLLLLSLYTPVDRNYLANALPASILVALGNAFAYLPATTAAVSGVKPEESGLASGLYNTTYQIGSAIGLVVMVLIAGATTAATLATTLLSRLTQDSNRHSSGAP